MTSLDSAALRLICHDLRAPARHVAQSAQILTDMMSADASAEAKPFLEILETSSLRMGSMLERLHQYVALEQVDPVRQTVMQVAQSAAAAHHIECVVSGDAEAQAPVDPTYLMRALCELLDNVAAHSGQDQGFLAVVGTGDTIEISVWDEGNGTDGDAQAALGLFATMRDGADVGMGLPIVERITALHGGHIRVTNRDPGFEAVLTLPALD